jgi:hypothetical protein
MTHSYPVTLLSNWLRLFSSQNFSRMIPHLFSNLVIIHLLAYEDGTECSETSAYEIQTPGNFPEENIQQMTNLVQKKFNTFITILYMYMFWAISCSSSRGKIVLIQHLVSSLTESDDTRCCINLLKPKRRLLYLMTQSVPRCKQFPTRL